MRRIKNVLSGFLALFIIAAILLVSDLSNRNRVSSKNDNAFFSGIRAVEGRQYRIGMTYFAPELAFDNLERGLWEELGTLGFVKDSNLTVIAQHAGGEMANLQPIHLNMDNQDVDLVIVTSTPGITASIPTVKRHPIVFTFTFTPLEAGAGKSYTDHLPNMTGVGSFPPVEKTMDFIREIIPGTKRIGTLYNSSEINSQLVVKKAREYLKENNIQLIENTVINSSEVYQAISALCMRNVDAVWITGDNTAMQAFHGIAKVCHENNMPLIMNDTEFVDIGALAAVGISWYAVGKRTASYVARVLNGESPANIPIENFVKEQITINPEIAAALKIKIPDKYLNPEIAAALDMNIPEKQINPTDDEVKVKKFKFCLAHYVDSPNSEDAEHGIRDELKKSGLVEGKDFTMKVYNAQGDISTLNSITEAISSEKWDLVFVTSTPSTQAISKKVTNSPIVFTMVGDPIKAGLGKSFTDHQANITGVSTMSDFKGMVALVKESMPGIQIIGTIYTPGEVNSVAYKEALEKAAQQAGLTLVAVPANSATEVADAALSIVNRKIQAFTQISDNLTASSGSSIMKVAYDNRIPYFAFIGKQVKDGAVAAIASDYYYAGVDAVMLAKQVLSGKPIKDIPFQNVSKSVVDVNREAAQFFGITIPEKYQKTK